MRFETSVQRLLIGLLVAFGAVLAGATYWAVAGPETALREPFNYRLRDNAGRIIRGDIYDRDEMPLVISAIEDDRSVTRHTSDPSFYSLAGYVSVQYGVGGTEAAYDTILRGADLDQGLESELRHDLLHIPREGSDIQLTIDLDVQQAAARALESSGQPGGAVVMDAATGEIFALVSAPTFDPATLDANWDTLIEDPGKPFLNRPIQGAYFPGGALQTAILTAWLIDGRSLDDPITGGADSVTSHGTSFACLDAPDDPNNVTVGMAYLQGCPNAFAVMVTQLGEEKFEDIAILFGLRTPVALAGFSPDAVLSVETPPPDTSPTPTPEISTPSGANMLRDEALGLGTITRSPLELAVMVAAVANGGNAPQPMILSAVRTPDSETWAPAQASTQMMAVTTAETSSQIANLLLQGAEEGAAMAVDCPGAEIGAHVGYAETEGERVLFFTGYVRSATGQTAVAVIAFEQMPPSSADFAAEMGGDVLCAALDAFDDADITP